MAQHYVSAEHIQKLFYEEKKRYRMPSWQLALSGVFIVLAVFLAINAPAIIQQLQYWYENDIAPVEDQAVVPIVPQVTTPTPGVTPAAVQPVKAATLDPQTLPDNTIYIPKTKTRAPIIWDVTGGKDLNTDMLNALQKGVVRYPQTALPDQIGNVFLTGHSSNYWWDPGKYKTIFALLDKLVVGDVVYLKYKSAVYTYRVNGQKIVQPTETSVLAPTKTATLSMMTCTPTGTSLLRRIVTADLISPTTDLKPQPTRPSTDTIYTVR
jgi:LPXTG-site transpeptidase (sortase) family protein